MAGTLSPVVTDPPTQSAQDSAAAAAISEANAAASAAAATIHIADLANPHAVTAAQLTLGNVDNTSDVNKPVSTAQQTALDLKVDATEKGAALGVATLDANSEVVELPVGAAAAGANDVLTPSGYLTKGGSTTELAVTFNTTSLAIDASSGTGMGGTITTQVANQKIKLTADLTFTHSLATTRLYAQFAKDGVAISSPKYVHSAPTAGLLTPMSLTWIDDVATASSPVYELHVYTNAGTVSLNGVSAGNSSTLAIEVL